MGSGNIPREIYVVGIVVFYIFFVGMYTAMVNTYTIVGTGTSECTIAQREAIQERSFVGNIIKSITDSVKEITLGTETTNMINEHVVDVKCNDTYPSWIGLTFIIMTALLTTMCIIVLLRG